jgi:hypothetical protein
MQVSFPTTEVGLVFVGGWCQAGNQQNSPQPSEAQNQCKYTYEDSPGKLLTSIEITTCLYILFQHAAMITHFD